MTENDPLPPVAEPVMPVTPSPAVAEPMGYAPVATGPGVVDLLKAGWAATPPFDQKLLMAGVAAAVVLAFSTLLTWLNVFISSVNGISTGTGKLVLVLALASIVATAAALARKLPAPVTWLSLAGVHAGVATWLLVLMFRYHHAFSGTDAGMADNPIAGVISGSFSLGIGLYLGLLAAIAGAAAYATLHAPSLAKFKLPAAPKPLGVAVGIGLAAGFLIGLFG